mgnify:CR=1 FL=1
MTAPFHPRRILVTRMKFIGDVVLTTPVIRSLRHAIPDAYIAYMGDAGAVSILEQNPSLNEIIPFDFSAPTLLEQPRVAWLLRRRKFDMVIDLFGNPRSALLTRLSGAPVRVGLDRPGRGARRRGRPVGRAHLARERRGGLGVHGPAGRGLSLIHISEPLRPY